jgi:lipoprotein-anchoring transpeptidase ErfK/SrfK
MSSSMTSHPIPASQVLKLAYEALRRGDKQAARRWGQIAARMVPEKEDPWLILAAVARPKVSIAYLERALLIDPHSERARNGLEWARRKLNEQTQTERLTVGAGSNQVKVPARPRPVAQKEMPSVHAPARVGSKSRNSLRILIILLLISLSAAWVFWPAIGSPTQAFIQNLPAAEQSNPESKAGQDNPILSWFQEALGQLTRTASPTVTITPTATASFTPSPSGTATLTPTFTVTPLPTGTPTPPEWLLEGEFVSSQFPQGGEKLIVVSISEQHLYAYQGGELVFSFIASTGMENATRPGTYHVLDKLPDAYASTWDIWMPNWMGIYQAGSLENGIHGLPIMQNGRRLWAGVLGAPISYGCVVLGVEESLALYQWAEVGVTVRIDY